MWWPASHSQRMLLTENTVVFLVHSLCHLLSYMFWKQCQLLCGTFCLVLAYLPIWWLPSCRVSAHSFTFTVGLYLYLAVSVVHEIKDALGIYCFRFGNLSFLANLDMDDILNHS
jgi:hypothetical protein